MRSLTVLLIALLSVKAATADPAILVKQKAKDIANQNNERQGLPPQYPSATPPPSAPAQLTAPMLTPEQQALNRLNTDLAGIKAENTPEQKAQLAGSLRANAHGPVKPSPAALKKLADDLTTALTGKTVSPAQRKRMSDDLVGVLNSANTLASQLDAIIADVPAILKKIGAGEKETAAVGDDLKAVAVEVRKKA